MERKTITIASIGVAGPYRADGILATPTEIDNDEAKARINAEPIHGGTSVIRGDQARGLLTKEQADELVRRRRTARRAKSAKQRRSK